MIVVDASAVAKLLIEESDSHLVKDWFVNEADDLAAPDLLAIEVAQAIVRRANMRQMPVSNACRALADWKAFLDGGAISLRRSRVADVAAAGELALTLGHPVKDCLYLALAIARDCDLATCDAKFHVKAAPAYPRVRLLAEFSAAPEAPPAPR